MAEKQMNADSLEQRSVDNMLASIPGKALAVILRPAEFFQDMPKTGGFVEPVVFVVAIAIASALLLAVAGLIGFGPVGMLAMGFVGVIVLPIMAVIGSFIGGAIVFVIWKIMGSEESFETSYRAIAYAYAYAPVAALVSGIPYLGSLVQVLWPMALLALASIHVHGRSPGLSWGVFGVLGLLLAFSSLSAEFAMRHLGSSVENWSRQAGQEEITPEDAGRAVGEFLKGLEQMQQGGGQ